MVSCPCFTFCLDDLNEYILDFLYRDLNYMQMVAIFVSNGTSSCLSHLVNFTSTFKSGVKKSWTTSLAQG